MVLGGGAVSYEYRTGGLVEPCMATFHTCCAMFSQLSAHYLQNLADAQTQNGTPFCAWPSLGLNVWCVG
jgi:hypothetical protein